MTSGSKSLKRDDLALSRELAERWDMPHRVIVTDELDDPNYRANPTNRCFYCKTSLYTQLAQIADAEGFEAIFNGTNLDDLGDHRPGLIAAKQHGVRSPLAETGFDKADIRGLAESLGLENAQKPQSACLSSRVPYGTAIDAGLLRQIERAESALLALGFSNSRVRHHGDVARLELVAAEFEKALARRDVIVERLKTCGYRFVALDLAGFPGPDRSTRASSRSTDGTPGSDVPRPVQSMISRRSVLSRSSSRTVSTTACVRKSTSRFRRSPTSRSSKPARTSVSGISFTVALPASRSRSAIVRLAPSTRDKALDCQVVAPGSWHRDRNRCAPFGSLDAGHRYAARDMAGQDVSTHFIANLAGPFDVYMVADGHVAKIRERGGFLDQFECGDCPASIDDGGADAVQRNRRAVSQVLGESIQIDG